MNGSLDFQTFAMKVYRQAKIQLKVSRGTIFKKQHAKVKVILKKTIFQTIMLRFY